MNIPRFVPATDQPFGISYESKTCQLKDLPSTCRTSNGKAEITVIQFDSETRLS